MRTDVKVGLVCVLALVFAVITYFVIDTKPRTAGTTADNRSTDIVDHNKEIAPAATPAADPTAVSSAPPASPSAVATPPIVAPPAAYSQEPAGQVSPPYTPAPATAPGSTLYPSSSGPRALLPPTGPVPPLTNETTTTAPATPSLVGPGERPGEPEQPSLRRDPLLVTPGTPPTHGLDTPDAPMAPAGTSTYIVVNGDNLTNIARKNHTTVAALKAANPTINPDKLKLKQPLNLPPAGTDVPPTPAHSATTRPGRSATTRPGHSAATRPAAVAAGTYTVKKGDTLNKIAKSVFGDEKLWRRIFRVNRGELADPNDLTPGMVLKIPAR